MIGQAGEFAVCAQMGKLGLIATPFAGNVPEYDVIVVNEALVSCPISVKATRDNQGWIAGDVTGVMDIDFDQATGRQTIIGPKALRSPDLITIYVWLSRSSDVPDRFFILTQREVQAVRLADYAAYLDKHGGVRPKRPDSFHQTIQMRDLLPYENRWSVIVDRLTVVE